MKPEDYPPRARSVELLKPVVRFVASAKPLAYIHTTIPKPCGHLHKKETSAIRCARRHGLAYVVVMVTWDRKTPGWLAWKNYKLEDLM